MPTSTVAFPGLSEDSRIAHSRPPHQPFRRISLPTASSLQRESIISVSSFDSLPEDRMPVLGSPGRGSAVPVVMRNVNIGRKKHHLAALEKRGNRRRELKVDDAREAKRLKIIHEFYETERAYVDGLELIYSHFLSPIIASLDTRHPLLDRAELTSVFSSFIDIWNLHRSFFSSLTDLLLIPTPPSHTPILHPSPPHLSPILLAHFPYLSLYTPFITSFHTTISSLAVLLSPVTPNPAFAAFIATQEAHPCCGKLKLRDWLLTIVQRCPRYLLLLKDLIRSIDPEDPEYAQLTAVHTLVSKITLSLNSSLHTHAQTLSLLALQRSTSNLPTSLHFITPGRNLLKRGALVQLERGELHEREFLLFSDCLVWLERERQAAGMSGWKRAGWGGTDAGVAGGAGESRGMVRSRSKSEAELSILKSRLASPSNSSSNPSRFSTTAPHSAFPHIVKRSSHNLSNMRRKDDVTLPTSPSSPNHGNRNPLEERWVYKGKGELVDLETVLVGGGIEDDGGRKRFEILSPEGSFAVYAATEQERDDWSAAIRQAKASILVTLNLTHPNSTLTSSASTNHIRRSLQALPFPPNDERLEAATEGDLKKGEARRERRGRVEHWVPAIWIPDAKTEGCMRCGKSFGWRRRRHHCRLCGRCVCATCSGRTFFISDPASNETTKHARACDACYETVFPLLDTPEDHGSLPTMHPSTNTVTSLTLAGIPSWLSMPSLPSASTPEALMAIDHEIKRETGLHRIDDFDEGDAEGKGGKCVEDGPKRRWRLRATRSYHQILEDFEDRAQGNDPDIESPSTDGEGGDTASNVNRQSSLDVDLESTSTDLSSSPRKGDTMRRKQRFSLPAIALQTTSVTARTGGRDGGGKAKRFSLVLGSRGHGPGRNRNGTDQDKDSSSDLAKGVAAVRLNELLGRKP